MATDERGEMTLARALARAVELGIRLHRESSPVHIREGLTGSGVLDEAAIERIVERVLERRERARCRADPAVGTSGWRVLHAN